MLSHRSGRKPDDFRRSAGWLFGGAAAFAAAELTAGLLIGRFFEWGRAEALLFFAFRPWLLLVAALLMARFGWRRRLAFYLGALVAAGLCESLLLLALGGEPWVEMLRGWSAGMMMVVAFDLLVQLGRRSGGRIGQAVATLLSVLILVVPGAMRPYEALALGRTGSRPVATRPPLLLMTGLPLVWGETGPFDRQSRPAAAYRSLQEEFAVRPIDYLDARTLAQGRLLLLAQPRALEPRELVAIDAWVRQGGNMLILADPDLVWPSHLPPGDVRRPPRVSRLAPLLFHWGLALAPVSGQRLVVDQVRDHEGVRRLTLAAPGRFVAADPSCRVGSRVYLAACAIGRGRAWLVADADLLHDEMWAAPTPRGAERHARLADNPLIVAFWLDRLAGVERERAAPMVAWQRPGASRGRALLLAAGPILFLLTLFAVLWAFSRRLTGLSTGLSAEHGMDHLQNRA